MRALTYAIFEDVHNWGVDYTMDGLAELETEIRDLRSLMLTYKPAPKEIILRLTGSLAMLKTAQELIRIGEQMAAR